MPARRRFIKETTVMLTNLAALGIGLITVVAAPAAVAQVPCNPVAYPSANYPSPNYPSPNYPGANYPGAPYPANYPTYGVPVPVYTPVPVVYPAPVPVYVPAQPPQRRVDTTPVSVRRADYNRDGGITFAEAYAYGRSEFARSDVDGNGVLTRRELNYRYDEIASGARRRDGFVTLAEYDASLRDQFYRLDRNRDGFLSSYELGNGRSHSQPNGVTFNWHWEL
jgi:EF hand